MKKLLILLVIGILFVGCNPCKRLTRLCPPEIHYDSIYIETVKLDTVVLISPADTTYIEIPAFTLEDLGIIVENEKQKITIEVVEGVFIAEVICKDDSLQQVIHSLETELHETTTIVPSAPEPEKYLSKFAKFTIIYFFCTVFLVIVVVIYRIKVGPLKSLLKRL